MRVYGSWAGNPKGHPEDPSRCIESVTANHRGAISGQGRWKRGHGKDGLYCKRHDPVAAKEKREKSYEEYTRRTRSRYAPFEFTELVRKMMASGLTDSLRSEFQRVLNVIDGKDA